MATATATATAMATATPTATPTPARKVRITFLPPPLEGTICLGIYNSAGKLVRVLHQEADLDEFTVEPDALGTSWDGKDDDGQDCPPGKYHAHGYLVGDLKVENLPASADGESAEAGDSVQIKLMANPLGNHKRPAIQVGVGFDDENSYLKTGDDLPLFTISRHGDVSAARVTKNSENSIDVWQKEALGSEHLRISNLNQMMAFDCGEFELK